MAGLRSFIFLSVLALSQANYEKYSGHHLYRIQGTASEIAALEGPLDLITVNSASRSSSGLSALIQLAPNKVDTWTEYFDAHGITYKLVSDDLGSILKTEQEKVAVARNSAKTRNDYGMSWDSYYRHEEVNDYLDRLAQEFPNLVTVINAGLSYEGRQIKFVRISTTNLETTRKPVIIIDAAIHAREWVTTPMALYIIHQLVVEISESDLTEEIDWVIIPLANPDGYEYSWDEDRLWRKTRSRSHNGADECPGVDGNRNYDHYWGTTESAADPCAIIYEGPTAFSESEVRVVRNVVMQYLSRTYLYLSLHSYGSMFLYAWGNNGTLPSNGLGMHLLGVTMAQEIDRLALPGADSYIVGNAAQVLYYTTGTSRDWTTAVGIPFSYTLELPGYDYDFLVPPEYIEQIVTETWSGIVAGAKYILSII